MNFRLRETSFFNPISMAYENINQLPFLSHHFLNLIFHHPNLYQRATGYEKMVLKKLEEQGLVERQEVHEQEMNPNGLQGRYMYFIKPNYLTKLYQINSSIATDPKMNQMVLKKRRYFSEEAFKHLQRHVHEDYLLNHMEPVMTYFFSVIETAEDNAMFYSPYNLRISVHSQTQEGRPTRVLYSTPDDELTGIKNELQLFFTYLLDHGVTHFTTEMNIENGVSAMTLRPYSMYGSAVSGSISLLSE